jgi:hypothetical protein
MARVAREMARVGKGMARVERRITLVRGGMDIEWGEGWP